MAPESVASILERETQTTIQSWFELVEQDAELACIPLTRNERTGHLPKLFQDLICRLHLNSGLPASISLAARDHGEMRCGQGYTAAMIVDEARFLEVSIFTTLQRNRYRMDRCQVLADIVTVADEVDSQLKQSMFSYVTFPMVMKSWLEGLPEKPPKSESASATLARVKKEMALPRVAASRRRVASKPRRTIEKTRGFCVEGSILNRQVWLSGMDSTVMVVEGNQAFRALNVHCRECDQCAKAYNAIHQELSFSGVPTILPNGP